MESIFCYAAGGDFQSKPEDNSAILHAFITDEWFDAHAERQKLLGKQPEHTFDADDEGNSRIDFFRFNKHLLPFFSSSGVLPQSRLPNHCPCFVELTLAPSMSQQQWVDTDVLVQPILPSAISSLIQAAESCDAKPCGPLRVRR